MIWQREMEEIEREATTILQSFATGVLPAKKIGLSSSFCDLVGLIHEQKLIGVKLKQSDTRALTTDQVFETYQSEILLMQYCTVAKSVRIELWFTTPDNSLKSLQWGSGR
jgi:hypothetical protein